MKKMKIAVPLVSSVPKHTDFLTILLTDEDGYNWLYCHYINFYYEALKKNNVCEKFSGGFLELGLYPKNTCCLIRQSEFVYSEVENDLLDFLIRKIEDNQYVISRIDQKYVPSSAEYGKNSYMHTTMIFGYDETKRIFYIYDFYNNAFQQSEISFENIKKAFASARQNLICVKRNDRRYKFSLERVITLLKDYYNGTDHTGYHFNQEYTIQGKPNYLFSTVEESNYEIIYGYKSTVKLIEDVCMVFPRTVMMHEVYEHKKLMVKRLQMTQEYLQKDLGRYIHEYQQIANIAKDMQNRFLKYQMKGQDMMPLLESAREIEEREGFILPVLIRQLEMFSDCEKK